MLLQAKGVTHYFGGLCAVSNFNLDLEEGELVGVIGPNGAGKTTVFNLITGVYKATKGSILFQNTELVGKRSNQITSMGIARTFQNIRLFRELSVLDNVRIAAFNQVHYNPIEALFHLGRFGREEQRNISDALDLLAVFKMEDFADETSKNLPYGLQRRLEIAACDGDPAKSVVTGRASRRDKPERDRQADGIHSMDPEGIRPDHYPD